MKEERIDESFESYSQWAGDIGDEVLTKNGFVLAVTRLLAEQKKEIVELVETMTHGYSEDKPKGFFSNAEVVRGIATKIKELP